MGDGSFGFTCGELETAARYRLPITFIVIANASYGWIKAGQKSGTVSATFRWISQSPIMPRLPPLSA